jgi:hypothetical protein
VYIAVLVARWRPMPVLVEEASGKMNYHVEAERFVALAGKSGYYL